MPEYIEREALLEDIQAAVENGGMGGMVAGALKRYVKRVPAIDVSPVRHGRWIHKEGEDFSYCSTCHYPVSYMWDMTNYCPNCGVKMGDDTYDLECI